MEIIFCLPGKAIYERAKMEEEQQAREKHAEQARLEQVRLVRKEPLQEKERVHLKPTSVRHIGASATNPTERGDVPCRVRRLLLSCNIKVPVELSYVYVVADHSTNDQTWHPYEST